MNNLQKIFTLILLCIVLLGCEIKEEPETISTSVPMQTSAQPTNATEPPETAVPTETAPVTEPMPEPNDADFVAVSAYIPDIQVDLKYATADNFTGQVIYEFSDVYLRYGTVKKLVAVQQELRSSGYALKIWDGFRPVSAQEKLWEICPDPTYVSHPVTGSRSHCRGSAVDVTLVDSDGNEVAMPTGFDDFSPFADRDYSDCEIEAANYAMFLETIMEAHGFVGYSGEWWHFADSETYDVDEYFDPVCISQWIAECEEYISLRTAPDTQAEVIIRIPAGEEMTMLGFDERFALVKYRNQTGYVLRDYIKEKSVG